MRTKRIFTNFKINKWLEELKELHDKVFFLQFNNKEFHNLANAFNNKKISYEIFRFARRNYVPFMSMGVRRLIDKNPQTISLIRLLTDIQNNSPSFKRNWFLKQYPGGINESLFKKFFGANESLKKDVVANDIKKLLNRTKKIKDYADKWEAHWDKKRLQVATPTFNDLDSTLICITRIYTKYYYLLKQSSISF